MYVFETLGKGGMESCIFNTDSNINGFAVGKQILNITVSMWKEDMKNGLLFKKELYDDGTFPVWWLNKVLKGVD
mgnify:CR=1 FL=1